MPEKKKEFDIKDATVWLLSLGVKKLLVLTGTSTVALLALLWGGTMAYGQKMFRDTVREAMKPVTDSLTAKVTEHDSVMDKVVRMVENQGKIQEQSIAAQRRASPKFDSALRRMAEDTESRRRYQRENKHLIDRLLDSTDQSP